MPRQKQDGPSVPNDCCNLRFISLGLSGYLGQQSPARKDDAVRVDHPGAGFRVFACDREGREGSILFALELGADLAQPRLGSVELHEVALPGEVNARLDGGRVPLDAQHITRRVGDLRVLR